MVNQIAHLREDPIITLSDKQKLEIKSYITNNIPPTTIGAFDDNRSKNLVFIIVESLNSWVIGKSYNNRLITPVLDSIMNQAGTVSCINVIPQVKDGNSSDGQLMYNTGLLPLRNGCTAILLGNNTFKSLANSLNVRMSMEFMAESASVWNHAETTKSYGYTSFVDNLYDDVLVADEAIFNTSIDSMRVMQQPFLAEITTISMHFPFDDQNVTRAEWIDNISCIDDLQREYLQMTHAFDAALGRFIDKMRKYDLYENSVIVIASDHHHATTHAGIEAPDSDISPITFIAVNTGYTKKIERTVGQIDIFPTILQIMNCQSEWRGLGTSILESSNASAVDAYGHLHGTSGTQSDSLKAKAWEISELILRSNYFNTKK